MSAALTERLVSVARAARDAGHGKRGAVYDAACAELGLSRATLLRKLKEVSVTDKRKKRADAGRSALSRDEARRLSPQEVDPIDEEAQAPVPATPPAKPKAKPRSPRDPLVDTTPFGSEPAVASADASAHADDEGDAALFGALWPLGDVVKLDATVDRRVLRQQRDRLGDLGYEFAPLSQDWHLTRV